MARYSILAYTSSSPTRCRKAQIHLSDAYVQPEGERFPRDAVRRLPVSTLLAMVARGASFSIAVRDMRDASRAQPVSFPLCVCGEGHGIEPRVEAKERPTHP